MHTALATDFYISCFVQLRKQFPDKEAPEVPAKSKKKADVAHKARRMEAYLESVMRWSILEPALALQSFLEVKKHLLKSSVFPFKKVTADNFYRLHSGDEMSDVVGETMYGQLRTKIHAFHKLHDERDNISFFDIVNHFCNVGMLNAHSQSRFLLKSRTKASVLQ